MNFFERLLKKPYNTGYDKGFEVGYKLGYQMGMTEMMNRIYTEQFITGLENHINQQIEDILEDKDV